MEKKYLFKTPSHVRFNIKFKFRIGFNFREVEVDLTVEKLYDYLIRTKKKSFPFIIITKK